MITIVITGDVMIDSRIARSNRWAEDDGADEHSPSKARRKGPSDHDGHNDDVKSLAKLFEPRPYLQYYEEESGAILLGKILEQALRGAHTGPSVSKSGASEPSDMHICYAADPKTESEHPVNYSLWRTNVLVAQFPRTKGETGDHVPPVWRIRERLGIDRPSSDNTRPLLDEMRDPRHADILAIEHLDQGFSLNEHVWPASLRSTEGADGRWLIVRWTRPRFDVTTDFWNKMVKRFHGRMIVVVTIESLRLFGMKINGLSWESLVSDLLKNLKRVWAANLDGCRHLVVSCAPAAAIIVSATSKANKPGSSPDLQAHLVYDPSCDETEWFSAYDGGMPGRPRCLMAGIILEVINWLKVGATPGSTHPGSRTNKDERPLEEDQRQPESECEALAHAALAGLLAGRYALHVGFDVTGHTTREDTSLPEKMRFPTSSVGRILRAAMQTGVQDDQAETSSEDRELSNWLTKERERFFIRKLEIPEVIDNHDTWGLINYAIPRTENSANDGVELASMVVRYGRDTAMPPGVPTLRIGNLFAIDRHEIENLRSIRELIDSYLSSTISSRPLSIAVFGDAGSGKSFAIRELAREFNERNRRGPMPQVREITLNLSQFTDPKSLATALHRVRDIGLSGEMPLVFWDEFDTALGETEMGWLRYFLAPMQDGVFQDGSSLHNVGRALFVFAGSSYPTMNGFLSHFGLLENEPLVEKEAVPKADRIAKAKKVKAPDFVSRLRGFVDVPTLNHDDGDHDVGALKTTTLLRRAELLRTFLLQSAGDLVQGVQREDQRGRKQLARRLNVDEAVIRAFLLMKKFRYGARSMEALVRMSTLKGKRMFDRSSLPTESQLGLHVDASEFLQHLGEGWAAPTPKQRQSARPSVREEISQSDGARRTSKRG